MKDEGATERFLRYVPPPIEPVVLTSDELAELERDRPTDLERIEAKLDWIHEAMVKVYGQRVPAPFKGMVYPKEGS